MFARKFFAPLLAALTLVIGHPVAAQQIVGGGSGSSGVSTPAVSPTSAYGTGVHLCAPTYSGVTYQWTRDGSNIGGSTSACRDTITADEGHDLAAAITTTAAHVTAHLAISGAGVTTAQLNAAYAGFTATVTGGATPNACSLTGIWPTGLAVNSSTCAVSGTPTQTGTFTSLGVRATDSASHTADLTPFDLVVSNYQPVGMMFSPATTYGVLAATLGANGGSDTTHFWASWWQKGGVGQAGNNVTVNGQAEGWNYYLGDFLSNYCPGAGTSSENCQGMNNVPDNAGSGQPQGTYRLNVAGASATDASPKSFGVQYNGLLPSLGGAWHHYIEAVDLSTSPARAALYVDGVKQAISATGSNTMGGANINFNSSNGWRVISRDNTTIHNQSFELADFILDTKTSTPTGCSGLGGADLIDSSGNICSALVGRLYSAGPVDPGTGCTGPSGYADICLHPDSSLTMANAGSATGTFALANPLSGGTDTAKVFRSPCDPGANGCPTDIPYPKWWLSAHATAIQTTSTGFTGDGVPNNQGLPISVGDFMTFAVATIETSSGTTRNPTCSTNGNAWTRIAYQETAAKMSFAVFTRTATSDDAATAGNQSSFQPVCTWGDGGTVALRGASYNWTNWGGSNTIAVQTTGSMQFTAGTNGTSISPPIVTSTGVTALASFHMVYSHTDTVSNPAQGSLLAFTPGNGSGSWPRIGVTFLRLTNGQTAGPSGATYSTDLTTTTDWRAAVNVTLTK